MMTKEEEVLEIFESIEKYIPENVKELIKTTLNLTYEKGVNRGQDTVIKIFKKSKFPII
jgi:hypothetical protein